MEIEVPCGAHIASAKEDGTAVAAVDESSKGVTVFGALRVTRAARRCVPRPDRGGLSGSRSGAA